MVNVAPEHLEGPVLHAATLTGRKGTLLVLGDPGEGKSTLSAALDAAGFTLLGDDLVHIELDGRVRALPFPLTLKDGSWSLVESFRPDLAAAPVFERPDGKIVRYLPFTKPASDHALPVRCVIMLNRKEGDTVDLEELRAVDMLPSLIGSMWSNDRTLSPSGFRAIVACIEGAQFFRVSFSTLDDAVSLVEKAWASVNEWGSGT